MEFDLRLDGSELPLSAPTNTLNVSGYDFYGNLLTNATQTVVFNGTVPDTSNCVAINEIMYNPALTNADYVELYNQSTNSSFDLSGWRVNGLGYTLPAGSLLFENSYLSLAKDPVALATAYGNTLPVFDQYGGNLDPNGETLTLFRPSPTNQEVVVDRVRYETAMPWPVITNGASLQLIDSAQDNSRVADWTAVPGPGGDARAAMGAGQRDGHPARQRDRAAALHLSPIRGRHLCG